MAMAKSCAANRKRFAKHMDSNSMLVLFAGQPPVKRGDALYAFAPQRNLLYLTGIDKPYVILLMVKDADGAVFERLYLQRFDEAEAKWTGAVLSADEAESLSGIDSFAYIDQFEDDLAATIVRHGTKSVYIDMENRSLTAPLTADLLFAERMHKAFPDVAQVNAYPGFARLRTVKAKDEIRYIRRAIRITQEGLYAMMRRAKPGIAEFELEAHFQFALMKRGVREPAFPSIIASGSNAAILHYSDNNSLAHDGDLILCDIGAQVHWYSADITRTFPVNGMFTERQALLYNIVLAAQQKVIDAIKPGVSFASLNSIAHAHYAKELKRIGLISKKDEVSRYYYHGVSHLLGLETHDAGRGSEGMLKKGMILTVEPGLYIEDESIGIRIEDDVLVTENGCEVLSDGIAKTVEEIEALMARRGRGYAREI